MLIMPLSPLMAFRKKCSTHDKALNRNDRACLMVCIKL